MGDFLDSMVFILTLPYHIFHTLTNGKYAKKEADKTIYKTMFILTIVFSIIGSCIYTLFHFSKSITK